MYQYNPGWERRVASGIDRIRVDSRPNYKEETDEWLAAFGVLAGSVESHEQALLLSRLRMLRLEGK